MNRIDPSVSRNCSLRDAARGMTQGCYPGRWGAPDLALTRNRGDRRPPAKARRAWRVPIDWILRRHDTHPAGFHEMAVSFADAEGIRRAIRDVLYANPAIAVKDAVKALAFIRPMIRVSAVATALRPDIAANPGIRQLCRPTSRLWWPATGCDVD